MMRARFAAIGECMIEISDLGGGQARLGFGGDTLNTALYLARLGTSVDYHTALGDDPYSARMLDAWQAEGIGTATVERVAGAVPGLYLVQTDARGERSFQFWRDQSPARRLTQLPGWAERARVLCEYEWLYLSAISLAILGVRGRAALLDVVRNARRCGAKIAFDSNYRPRNWPDAETARRAVLEALALTDLALPTFEDERQLFVDASIADTVRRLRAHGITRAAIKSGPEGCVLLDGEREFTVAADPVPRVVDTTAAGDSFNAGFLAALVGGADPVDAARSGHRLAAVVIQHRGAVIPRAAMPDIAAPVAVV
jgi:2-dehydro-3-deoxygluconokinase